MNNPTVAGRESKRADELEPGNWLAAYQIPEGNDRPNEVLGVHPYTDGDEPAVLLVYRASDGAPRTIHADSDQPYDLATDAELDAGRVAADRAKFATGLREFADWV